jgi:WD40 repeat protein
MKSLSLAFSPDGRLLASGGSYQDTQVRPCLPGLARMQKLEGHSQAVTSLAFSPQGQYLASGSYNGDILLWGLRP